MEQPSFNLPIISRIVLRGFSLYTERTEIDVSVRPGVFCLVGANGLGKSTFVAAVNYALCGRVPDPGRTFQSAEEYFQVTERFTSTFFAGRINEFDRPGSEIEIEFSVGNDEFRLVRGMFEPNQLRSLTIKTEGSVTEISSALAPSQVNEKYRLAMANSVGVSTFEQFAFLQLFVFTFDESRNLTFWNQRVQRQLLLIAFGDDIASSEEAENLRRQAERLDSIARNANYQATETRKLLNNAQRVLADLDPETLDLRTQHEKLDSDLEDLLQQESVKLASISDSKLAATELRARSIVLRDQIDESFHSRGLRTRNLLSRPIIAESVTNANCQICGAQGEQIADAIRSRTTTDSCPLCGTDLPLESEADPAMDNLIRLDRDLSELDTKIEAESQKQRRLQIELGDLQSEITLMGQQIAQFERQHLTLPTSLSSTNVIEIRDSMEANTRVIRDLHKKRDDARVNRQELLNQLQIIQEGVAGVYAELESKFVKSFRGLAEAFLGLDIDVQLDTRRNDLRLVLEVAGQTRREHHQMSESQRFFVDIALRMAILKLMATESGSGLILVDTPEGSLDIAYESRAGEMFAQFVEEGFNIIMTANINTSHLIRRLAQKCGNARMYMERMTQWTMLSEVQLASEHLFDEAYAQIELDLAQAES